MKTDPHKNYSPNWCTDPAWMEWASVTMGGIALDPCADVHSFSPAKNRYYGPAGEGVEGLNSLDGLHEPWEGSVYCNPPGSNSSKSVKPWWHKYNASPGVTKIVWCFFNNEISFLLDPCPFDLNGFMVMPNKRTPFMKSGELYETPRNRAWMWTNTPPAPTPYPSRVIQTGHYSVRRSYDGAIW